MKPELYRAINNRDGAAMASIAGGNPEHGRVVNSDAERLVDALFMQLKQIFPAATQTNLRSDADERVAKQQWIAAFQKMASAPASSYPPECRKPVPASLHSGRRQVSLFRGAVRGVEHSGSVLTTSWANTGVGGSLFSVIRPVSSSPGEIKIRCITTSAWSCAAVELRGN